VIPLGSRTDEGVDEERCTRELTATIHEMLCFDSDGARAMDDVLRSLLEAAREVARARESVALDSTALEAYRLAYFYARAASNTARFALMRAEDQLRGH
jgi:hypothetical protein